MTTIVTRTAKGAALTWAEADQNFTNLNSAKLESLSQDTTPSLGGNLDTGSRTISSSTGNVIIDDVAQTNALLLNINAGLTSDAVGKIVYDSAFGSLTYRVAGNNVTVPIGQREVQQIYNGTGVTLQKGQIVYIAGSQGNNLTVQLASASSEATSTKTIGMVSETILNGATGFITTNGIADKIDTSLYTQGTALWLSATSGLFTDTRPTAPDHAVFIGWVIRSHATTGSIYVHVQNGYELEELHNVLITTPSSNQVLKYDGAKWVNSAETDPVFSASPSFGITGTNITNWNTAYGWGNHATAGYQSSLVSGTNIKTINSTSLLGSGDIAVQPTLVSGTNIKTVNGSTLLGSGNIVVSSGTGLGSLTAYKADGTQDDLPVNATTSLNQLTINQELLYNKAALIAIDTTGNYGWRDITSDINVKGSGTNSPTWGVVRNGINAFLFDSSTMNECWFNFHINHDYALGTPIYLHAHWVNPSTSTGVVRFGFEYTIAKGHQQEVFPASTTIYVEQACTGQYYHHVAEISTGITSASLEPDAIVMVRLFRDASHVNDTNTNAIAIIASDIHYQANRFATKNKAPAFNV